MLSSVVSDQILFKKAISAQLNLIVSVFESRKPNVQKYWIRFESIIPINTWNRIVLKVDKSPCIYPLKHDFYYKNKSVHKYLSLEISNQPLIEEPLHSKTWSFRLWYKIDVRSAGQWLLDTVFSALYI